MSVSTVTASTADGEAPLAPSSGSRRTLWGGIAALGRQIASSRRMLIGVIILVIFILMAIFGPIFEPHPNALGGPPLAGPSGSHWLGTTQSGQDVFAQLIASARGTLEVGFAVGILATLISVFVGVAGGFIGGWSDEFLNLLTNVALVIPSLPLVIIIAADLKSSGTSSTILVVTITSWAGSSRVLRGLTLSIRNRDYILASRVSGERTWRIVCIEMLPNLSAFVISGFIFSVIFAILTQAGLAFIGLESPDTSTWGNMLYFAQNDEALSSGAWWWIVPPGLCIALVGTALSMINFGLDEAVNPRLRVFKSVKRAKRRQEGTS